MIRPLAGSKRLFAVAVAVLIASAVILTGVTLQRRASCHDAVHNREGIRSMWLYALEITPESPRVSAFRRELDLRIPELHCVGWLGGHVEPKKQAGE